MGNKVQVGKDQRSTSSCDARATSKLLSNNPIKTTGLGATRTTPTPSGVHVVTRCVSAPFQYSPLRSVSFDVQHLSYPLIFVDFEAFVIYLKSFWPSREAFITCNIDPLCLPQIHFPVRCGSFRHIQNALFIPMLTNVAFGPRACV